MVASSFVSKATHAGTLYRDVCTPLGIRTLFSLLKGWFLNHLLEERRRRRRRDKGKGEGIGKKMGQLASKLCGSVRICVGSEALEVHVDTKVPTKSGERARSGVAAPHEEKVEDIEFTGKANISLGVKIIKTLSSFRLSLSVSLSAQGTD